MADKLAAESREQMTERSGELRAKSKEYQCGRCGSSISFHYLDVRARLAAHTEAAKLALEVLEDELGVRMESFSAKRQDGTYDRSVCDQQELANIESCEAAIKALTDAISAPDPPSTEPADREPKL